MVDEKAIQEAAQLIAKALVDKGLLIEAGFEMFAAITFHKNTPEIQREEMRFAFMAGAQHLFGSIMGVLEDDGDEPTDMDLQRMDKIDQELRVWRDKLAQRYRKPEGTA